MADLLFALYWSYFKVGLFSYGGGYAMIPIMESEIIIRHGWLTRVEFVDIIAVAEMTPGPIAVNSATFVGFRLAGITGSLIATLGIITPSLLILLLLSSYLMKLVKSPGADRAIRGMRPAVIALLLLAAFSLGQTALVDRRTTLITAGLLAASLPKKSNPLYIIAAGALLGLIFYPY